jgi:hypothetical protein
LLIRGFELASRRFNELIRCTDPDAIFMPLFEALNWAVSIDDRLKDSWEAEPRSMKWWTEGFTHGEVVNGVRFARNRVHHQWADALGPTYARTLDFPAGFIEWRWHRTLPPGRDTTFEPEYEARVAGNPARLTLGQLSVCFREAYSVVGAPR